MNSYHMLYVRFGLEALACICMLAMFLTACTSPLQDPQNSRLETGERILDEIGVHEFNNLIELELADEDQVNRAGQAIDITVSNRSDMTVWFPIDYGSRLFVLIPGGNTWKEIENEARYIGDGDLLEPIGAASGNWVALVTVLPAEVPVAQSAYLRVVLVGQRSIDNRVTDEKVASYLDIELSQ